MTATNLNPLTLPLQGQQLIEASAGTGKTYTLSALYLRLVLGHQQLFDQGERILLPPDILVMTFTEAATAELRERIRLRLQEAKWAFETSQSDDHFLSQLLREFAPENYPFCVQKLTLAIEWMDEAAIFTIHGWASRMLRQHAFDSLSLFEQTLVEDTYQLKLTACKRYWRQVYYALEPTAVAAVTAWVANPEALLSLINSKQSQEAMNVSTSTPLVEPWQALAPWVEWKTQLTECFAQLQTTWTNEVTALIQAAKTSKALNGRSYQEGWFNQLLNWLQTGLQQPPLEKLMLVSSGGFVTSNKGSAPEHPAFDLMASYVRLVQQEPDYQTALLAHARAQVNLYYQHEKQQAGLFDFDDLLQQLYQALQGEAGEALAQAMRTQFPVALVDEFQDTDPWQYGCLMPLYQHRADCVLLMIGDPKQAIYRFRGADMDTYLQARRDARFHHTLTQNYRSSESVIQVINRLFGQAENHAQGAFQFKQCDENPIPFVEVSAGKSLPKLMVSGQTQAALTLWAIATQETVSREVYTKTMARRCADQIGDLLAQPSCFFQSEAANKRIEAGDIAVLVRKTSEALAIQQALRERRIPSVYLSDKESVFASEEALDMWRWLLAVHEPESTRAIRAALASRSFAFALAQLDELRDDQTAWDEWVSRFRSWRDTWQQQGVLAMLTRLMHEQGIAHFWQQQPEGERKLTNLLHLAEVLQQASLEREGRTALIRWLAMHISQPQAATAKEHLVRLESDASCVTIITIHKSKGLEYPLVFLPFAMSLGMDKRQTSDEHERQLDWQESIRLLYVALTRASHALWLGVAGFKSSSQDAGFFETALGYLLAGNTHSGNESDWAQFFDSWKASADGLIDWQLIDAHKPCQLLANKRVQDNQLSELTQSALTPKPRYWPYTQVTSYSRITQGLEAQQMSAAEFRWLEDQAMDNSRSVDDDPLADLPLFALIAEPTPWQALPAGAGVGDLMHKALEAIATESALNQGDSDWQTFWQQQLGFHQLPLNLAADFHAWLSTLAHMPIQLASGQFTLNKLSQGSFWCEMGFTLPLSQTNTQAIDTAVSGMVLVGASRPKLSYQRLGGLLTGFMDLIIEHEGRFYVLDYKTNKLDKGYDDASCAQAMLNHRYDVQAMLYVLALHRHLSIRLPHYDYEQHMGGAIYWFIRGADAQHHQQGVWQSKPSLAELEHLSRYFSSSAS